jgi:hypothetical protein
MGNQYETAAFLLAIEYFVLDTPGAKDYNAAVRLRGMTFEQAAEEIRAKVARAMESSEPTRLHPAPRCPLPVPHGNLTQRRPPHIFVELLLAVALGPVNLHDAGLARRLRLAARPRDNAGRAQKRHHGRRRAAVSAGKLAIGGAVTLVGDPAGGQVGG